LSIGLDGTVNVGVVGTLPSSQHSVASSIVTCVAA